MLSHTDCVKPLDPYVDVFRDGEPPSADEGPRLANRRAPGRSGVAELMFSRLELDREVA